MILAGLGGIAAVEKPRMFKGISIKFNVPEGPMDEVGRTSFTGIEFVSTSGEGSKKASLCFFLPDP